MAGLTQKELLKTIESVFSCRHKGINTNFDNMIASLKGPANETADLTASEAMFEVGRATMLNLNSIAESLATIAAALSTKPE